MMPLMAMVFLAGAVFFTGCEKKTINVDMSENIFQGRIIGLEKCTENIIGYLIDVWMPDEIGDSLKLNGIQYANVVKTYSTPQKTLSIGDTILGKYHVLSDTMSTKVCNAMNPYYDVLEIIVHF